MLKIIIFQDGNEHVVQKPEVGLGSQGPSLLTSQGVCVCTHVHMCVQLRIHGNIYELSMHAHVCLFILVQAYECRYVCMFLGT